MGQITLTWGIPTTRADLSSLPVSQISKYVIEYGQAGAALTSIDITNASATMHTIEGLTAGELYRARISAVDTSGRTSQLSGFIYPRAAVILSLPTSTPAGDGAELAIDSNSAAGALYSYSKATPFSGSDAEIAAEIIANGVSQVPVVGTNTRTVTGQDSETPYYAGWVQDAGSLSNVVLTSYITLAILHSPRTDTVTPTGAKVYITSNLDTDTTYWAVFTESSAKLPEEIIIPTGAAASGNAPAQLTEDEFTATGLDTENQRYWVWYAHTGSTVAVSGVAFGGPAGGGGKGSLSLNLALVI